VSRPINAVKHYVTPHLSAHVSSSSNLTVVLVCDVRCENDSVGEFKLCEKRRFFVQVIQILELLSGKYNDGKY
jgi:hypothetical protein